MSRICLERSILRYGLNFEAENPLFELQAQIIPEIRIRYRT